MYVIQVTTTHIQASSLQYSNSCPLCTILLLPPDTPPTHLTYLTLIPTHTKSSCPGIALQLSGERGGREFGNRDFPASKSSSNANSNRGSICGSTSGGGGPNSNVGRDFGNSLPGHNREYSANRDGPAGPQSGREYGPGFRDRDRVTGREFPLQNQQLQAQGQEFRTESSGGGGCHSRDKDSRWGDLAGQVREAGNNSYAGNVNQAPVGAPTSALPSATLMNRDPVSSPQNSSGHPPFSSANSIPTIETIPLHWMQMCSRHYKDRPPKHPLIPQTFLPLHTI